MFRKIFMLISVLFTAYAVNAQVLSNGTIKNQIANSNAFLDASTWFGTDAYMDNNTGIGLVFPTVDLTTFEFDDMAEGDGGLLPTYYNGMVVYNRATGSTPNPISGNYGKISAVTPGFYYFYNPNATNVKSGEWKPLGSGGGGGNILPPDFCFAPCDCDGDGVFSLSCSGTDTDDNNPCSPAVSGLTASLSQNNVAAGTSVVITVTAGAGSDAEVNNLSIDGGNTLIEGNSITVKPDVTTTYIIRVNNCGSQIVAVKVTVIPAPPLVQSITVSGQNEVAVNKTIQLSVAVSPLGSNQTVTWSSSNPAIASVSAGGVVTGVAIGGPVTITATATDGSGISGSKIVNVDSGGPAGYNMIFTGSASSWNGADNTCKGIGGRLPTGPEMQTIASLWRAAGRPSSWGLISHWYHVSTMGNGDFGYHHGHVHTDDSHLKFLDGVTVPFICLQ